MGYVKLDITSIRTKALRTEKARNRALIKAERITEREKDRLIEAFESHPVTKEIAAGPLAPNTSNTLGGYGNLFSFIGFDAGSDPITPVKNLLEKIEVKNLKYKVKNQQYIATVRYPEKEEIRSVSPLPFETGKSWVVGIEKGISGFTQYIYKKFLKGKSKEGLQSEKMDRSGNYQKTNYLFSMLSVFVKNIKGGKNDYSV